ncbi:hypothetical protein MKW94_025931, partial [Papaver nudicaule]|nr:hypothetical protein [Papaver nudicaule]
VYIVRARSLADVDLSSDLPNIDIPAQGSFPGCAGAEVGKIIKKCTGKYLSSQSAVPIPREDQHMVLPSTGSKETNATNRSPAASHPSVTFFSGDGSTNLEQAESDAAKRSPAKNLTESHPSIPFPDQNTNLEQPEDNSNIEVMDANSMEDVRLTEPVAGVQEFTNFNSFTIIVNDMLMDPIISEDIRTKYYELCRSQKAYLHKHLTEGLNCKIVAEIISDIVNIADAIRASKLSTPKDTFEALKKSLLVYKHLGMSVEFLLSRVGIALAFDYNGAVLEENRLKEEITAHEAKILELTNDLIKLQRALATSKGNREKQELAFMVNSPW